MNAEQKQRAKSVLTNWIADGMAALLQELIDAPEQAVGVPDCWPTDEMVLRGAEQLHDLGIQCETEMQQDIVESVFKAMLAAAPEAPEAPAAITSIALREVGLTRDTNGVCIVTINGREAIRDNGDIISHYATLDWFSEAPAVQADMVKDAERYRWLRTYNTAKHPAVTEAFFLGDENLDAEIDAAIAAEKGGAA